jgi:endonuclease YncB( thermonuclease family)
MDAAYVYRATCERVIDGDTYVLRIDLGFRCAVSFEARLHGIDCPERNTRGGARGRGALRAADPAGLASLRARS